MTKAQEIQAERDEARARLREWLKPGDSVTTVLRHVSASGMSRSITLVIARDNAPLNIDYWVARATGDKIDQTHGGIKVGGVGMDMGFHLVYGLGHALWPDGVPCAGPQCRSNDHTNGLPRPQFAAPGVAHTDSGYALSQHWL